MSPAAAWSDFEVTLRLLCEVLFVSPDGAETSQEPRPAPPGVEQEADDWMRRFARRGELPPLPDRLRAPLLARATCAASFAEMAAGARLRPIAGDPAEVLERLLVDSWHSSFRALWLSGLPMRPMFPHSRS